MPRTHALLLSSFVVVAAVAPAQSPLLTMSPVVSVAGPSPAVQWGLSTAIADPHVVLLDLGGGPREVLGETFLLGFSSALTPILFASSSNTGQSGSFAIPANPALDGNVIYGQFALFSPSAPNGSFTVGNGASTVLSTAPMAIALDFSDPVAEGFVGNYRSDVTGHIRGGAVLHRTHSTRDNSKALFGAPIQSPLVPTGCREQMVFRTQDLGATGAPELVTGVSWLTQSSIQFDSFLQFEMRMGHTAVTPDYSLDAFSGLAVAPGSGLSSLFAVNELAGAPTTTVFQGRYDIDPNDQQLALEGRLMPFPAISPFAYDGVSSLLLDFRTNQGQLGVNGMAVQLMVASGPLPAARAVSGVGVPPQPIPNPGQVTQADIIDSAMPVLEFEFARVQTNALSPWLDSGVQSPDYDPAIIAASKPIGTDVEVLYRGSFFADGLGATAWSTNQDIADGARFLQIDIRLLGNALTDEVPLVDTLVVPVR